MNLQRTFKSIDRRRLRMDRIRDRQTQTYGDVKWFPNTELTHYATEAECFDSGERIATGSQGKDWIASQIVASWNNGQNCLVDFMPTTILTLKQTLTLAEEFYSAIWANVETFTTPGVPDDNILIYVYLVIPTDPGMTARISVCFVSFGTIKLQLYQSRLVGSHTDEGMWPLCFEEPMPTETNSGFVVLPKASQHLAQQRQLLENIETDHPPFSKVFMSSYQGRQQTWRPIGCVGAFSPLSRGMYTGTVEHKEGTTVIQKAFRALRLMVDTRPVHYPVFVDEYPTPSLATSIQSDDSIDETYLTSNIVVDNAIWSNTSANGDDIFDIVTMVHFE